MNNKIPNTIIGMWWNPNKAGEGFVFSQEEDPETGDQRVIGYFYTYVGIYPTWYILDLIWQSPTVLFGDVLVTAGTSTSSPGDPGNITEERVGSCTISGQGERATISLRINSKIVSYTIGSLFGTGLPAWNPNPTPVPDPEPEPEPDPIPKVVTWDKKSDTGQWHKNIGGSHGSSNLNELYGSSPVDIDDINPRGVVGRYQLNIVEGPIRIKGVSGDGPYNPQVQGLLPGEILETAEERYVELRLGPGDPPPSGWVHSSFIVDGIINGETVRLMTVSSQVAERA